MVKFKPFGALVGPAPPAILVSELPLFQPQLYGAQTPPVVNPFKDEAVIATFKITRSGLALPAGASLTNFLHIFVTYWAPN